MKAFIAFAAALFACGNACAADLSLPKEAPKRAPIADELLAAKDPRAVMAGKTLRFFDPGHGNQIEFYSDKGVAYLWYPGNTVSVPSRWSIEDRRKPGAAAPFWAICFVYGTDTYNPVTMEHGGAPECSPLSMWVGHIRESIEGDAFSLALGGVPWPLDKNESLTLASAEERFEKK